MSLSAAPAAKESGVSRRTLFVRLALAAAALGLLLLAGQRLAAAVPAFQEFYYGSLAGELAQPAGGTTSRGPADWGLLGLGLVATVLVTRIVTRLAGRALREATGVDGQLDTETEGEFA